MRLARAIEKAKPTMAIKELQRNYAKHQKAKSLRCRLQVVSMSSTNPTRPSLIGTTYSQSSPRDETLVNTRTSLTEMTSKHNLRYETEKQLLNEPSGTTNLDSDMHRVSGSFRKANIFSSAAISKDTDPVSRSPSDLSNKAYKKVYIKAGVVGPQSV